MIGYINSNYKTLHPFEVLELVTKFENSKLDDVAVFLVIDGIHNMINELENDRTNQTLAYIFAEDVPDLNKASCTQLQIIDQIDRRKADMIIVKRNKREFKDLTDAVKRLQA
ncbi:10219_t:CDS:2 [Funneliformis caledonium]|uniref:10219_t:CDS:1 n=1 Tax=Funneliformis caledonium TaxID=1117310 RepID=A0A9N9I564_9GLOM|nr:10219_t:CDS:2 [Funneliformis caledonium]